MKFSAQKLVIGVSVGEDFIILACVVLTPCQRVTDGQTDRQQIDIPTVAKCMFNTLIPTVAGGRSLTLCWFGHA